MKITRRQLRQMINEATISELTKNMGKHEGKDKKLNKMKFVDFKDGLKNSLGVMNMFTYNTATGNFFMMEWDDAWEGNHNKRRADAASLVNKWNLGWKDYKSVGPAVIDGKKYVAVMERK